MGNAYSTVIGRDGGPMAYLVQRICWLTFAALLRLIQWLTTLYITSRSSKGSKGGRGVNVVVGVVGVVGAVV